MPRNTVDDLDESPAAVGGAMSKWPHRTLAYACRDLRVEIADPAVVDALLDTEVPELRDLADMADGMGIDPSNLEARTDALDAADADTVLAALNQEYRGEWQSDSPGGPHGCPFEESGLDKACWRCPVPSRALTALEDERVREAPDDEPPEATDP
jgi:hypothetical protein